jgi:hypothetical protein
MFLVLTDEIPARKDSFASTYDFSSPRHRPRKTPDRQRPGCDRQRPKPGLEAIGKNG